MCCIFLFMKQPNFDLRRCYKTKSNHLVMKNLKITFLVCLIFSSADLFSQSKSILKIGGDGTFEISTTNLREFYTLDIASLNLKSTEEAVTFFSKKNTELIIFRPQADGETATVFLQLSKRPKWTVSDWNNALSEVNLNQ